MSSVVFFFPLLLQQAKEMVNEILRERDHAGFGDRNEYGPRMGGGGSGLNVCVCEAFRHRRDRLHS